MNKRWNILCLLVLAAFGFIAWVPGTKGTGQTEEIRQDLALALPVVNTDNPKSHVVEGSFTSKILPAQKAKGECGAEVKENYADIVVPLSKKHGLDWRLVTAIMAAESSLNPCAVSPAGAMGLMQIMPAVAEDFKVNPQETFDPDENIRAGVLLLKRLNKKFQGNLKLTVAAYNAGAGNVDRYKGIPPFKETQNYVKKVLTYHKELKMAKVNPYSASPMKILAAR
jgi:soluble lytic murein transglycosylase-like protein